MATEWRIVDGQRIRVVEEDVLLGWWRDRMDASPAHQYRLRKRVLEAGGVYTAPPRPAKPAPAPAPDDDAAPEAEQPRPYEPLDHMKPMTGRAEYSTLAKALRRTPTPCRDVAAFTADPTPANQLSTMAGLCETCPLARLCAAYAAAGQPTVGFWAGKAMGRVSGGPATVALPVGA